MLKCLNRLEEPTSGSISINGQEVTGVRNSQVRALRQSVAMIFQQFNLVPRFSVLKNVLMGRLSYLSSLKSILGLFSETDLTLAKQNLKKVGLTEKMHMRTEQLSGGEQQRVAIARALTQQPAVILADEPVASLDPAMSAEVMAYLKAINLEMKMTVLCNLHLIPLAQRYSSRVIALRNGELIFDGPSEALDEDLIRKIYGSV